jgi:hypothetical protein
MSGKAFGYPGHLLADVHGLVIFNLMRGGFMGSAFRRQSCQQDVG